MTELRIGEFAAIAGVSADTVRYYEKVKLLPRAGRTVAGYRLYDDIDVERIQFIKQAQALGLSLNEIKSLLTARGGAEECRQVRDLLQAKLSQLDDQVQMLRSFRRTLADHLVECERQLQTTGDGGECPVIVDISRPQNIPKKNKRRKS
jgi:DNA-binding transcriptional MerR regulator